MNMNIDSTFSIYQLVKRKKFNANLINHRPTMSVVSYLIEDASRLYNVNNTVFAGFQYLSKFLPQVKRYREVAQNAEHVYIFGVPNVDTLPEIPNLTYVYIEPHYQLAKEWFVVSHGPDFSTALATEEITNFTDPDELRKFNGVWLIDDMLIPIMHEWLQQSLGQRTDMHPTPTISESGRHKAVLERMASNLWDRILARRPDREVIQQELQHFLKNHLNYVLS